MILLILDHSAAEHQREAGLDEEDTDHDAEGYRQKQRIEERVSADQDREDTEDQLQDPHPAAERLCVLDGIEDRHDTHHHDPDGCDDQRHALRKEQGAGEYQQNDTQDNAQDIKHKADAESFSGDGFDNADNTEYQHKDYDKVFHSQECVQRSEHTGKTAGNHQNAENNE